MTGQNSYDPEVQAMRLAAERGDWNSWGDATTALLLHLPSSHSVRLARDFVARRLPAFERQQPGVHWPRELLEAVTEEGVPHSDSRWSFEDEFSGPGGASFKKAMESLWIASLRRQDARQCAAELVHALSEAIMAEMVEHWGSRHPDEWNLWHQLVWSEEDNRRMFELQLAMMKDPDVKRLERTGCLEVADLLEMALRERARSPEGPKRHP
jgi:hypothetical protein